MVEIYSQGISVYKDAKDHVWTGEYINTVSVMSKCPECGKTGFLVHPKN